MTVDIQTIENGTVLSVVFARTLQHSHLLAGDQCDLWPSGKHMCGLNNVTAYYEEHAIEERAHVTSSAEGRQRSGWSLSLSSGCLIEECLSTCCLTIHRLSCITADTPSVDVRANYYWEMRNRLVVNGVTLDAPVTLNKMCYVNVYTEPILR